MPKSESLFRSFAHKNERFARKAKDRIPNPAVNLLKPPPLSFFLIYNLQFCYHPYFIFLLLTQCTQSAFDSSAKLEPGSVPSPEASFSVCEGFSPTSNFILLKDSFFSITILKTHQRSNVKQGVFRLN